VNLRKKRANFKIFLGPEVDTNLIG